MTTPRSSASPGPAREIAHRILLRVSEEGAWASRLLEAIDAERLDARDVALVHEIVQGVLRWRGRIDRELSAISSRPLDRLDPPVREALRLGAYQILFLDRVPSHAAVDASVALARRSARRGAEGLVNAVLRRLAERGKLAERPGPQAGLSDLAAELSHPEWLVVRALERLGADEARAWLLANNQPPPVSLRPNPLHPAAPRLAAALEEQGVRVAPGRLAPGALRVLSGKPARTELFRDGAFWIQDEASQVVPLLFPPPWRGLSADLCAAPGGKTFVLATGDALLDPPVALGASAESPGDGPSAPAHRVVAFDLHPHRLARLCGMARRVAPGRIGAVAADLSAMPPVPADRFDRVLVDAPCSGTGVLRRHPEIRWRLIPERLTELASLQSRLLDIGLTLVRPGGHLVYSVCSFEPEEGDEVLEAFLARSGAVSLDPRPWLPGSVLQALDGKGRLRTSPARHESDGFFAAVVQKPAPIG